jgi:hypothetical protein
MQGGPVYCPNMYYVLQTIENQASLFLETEWQGGLQKSLMNNGPDTLNK